MLAIPRGIFTGRAAEPVSPKLSDPCRLAIVPKKILLLGSARESKYASVRRSALVDSGTIVASHTFKSETEHRKMKITEGGKEHRKGDLRCSACESIGGERRPRIHADEITSCPGLVHSENVDDLRNGSGVVYVCDVCGPCGG
jgi:hypothetical protein